MDGELSLNDMVERGMTIGEISLNLNVSYGEAHRYVRLLQTGHSVKPYEFVGPKRPRGRPRKPKMETPGAARKRERIERIVALHNEGLCPKEISAQSGHCYDTVRHTLRRAGITAHNGWKKADTEREKRMVSMYRQGITLEAIGEAFGVSRERIRQLIKRHGVVGAHGGARKVAQAKREAVKVKRDARSLAKWGMAFDEVRHMRRTGILKSFEQQRRNAHARGIEWGLTLAQWWDVWQTSGKWEKRGRGAGAYCMSRIRDSGGYVVGNVHIQLTEENGREAVKKWRGKKKANRGVYCLYPGNAKPWLASVGGLNGSRLGFFATESEAVAARLKYASENGFRVTADGRVVRSA